MQTFPIAIVIPTKGRADILAETLESIAGQTLAPDQVIVSATCAADLRATQPAIGNLEAIFGPAGLTLQRNVARSRLRPDVQLVFLLDDDLELAEDYLEQMADVFQTHPEVALLGGNLLANGEITRGEAKRLLACTPVQSPVNLEPARALYGCNMVVRADIFRRVPFDENLRLAGWLEDFDWSIRVGELGAIMICNAARAVHLKVDVNRTSGYRFGYAQVINPYYLYRKGTIPNFGEVIERHWIRLLTSNIAGLIRRDRQIDRFGRLRGNLRAFGDIAMGHPDPTRIELLETQSSPKRDHTTLGSGEPSSRNLSNNVDKVDTL